MPLPEVQEKERVVQALAVLLTRALLNQERVVLSITDDNGTARLFRVHAEEVKEPGAEVQQELPLTVPPTMESFLATLEQAAQQAEQISSARPGNFGVLLREAGSVLAGLAGDFLTREQLHQEGRHGAH